MSKPIKEYMTRMPHSVGHDIPLERAIALMEQYSCHHLPVLDAGHLVGILSDRDIQVARRFDDFLEMNVEEIMTPDPVVVDPDQDIFQVAMLMHQKKIGSVIVSAKDNEPWGIFTATDALAYFTEK